MVNFITELQKNPVKEKNLFNEVTNFCFTEQIDEKLSYPQSITKAKARIDEILVMEQNKSLKELIGEETKQQKKKDAPKVNNTKVKNEKPNYSTEIESAYNSSGPFIFEGKKIKLVKGNTQLNLKTNFNKILGVVVHWTADDKLTIHDKYHVNILSVNGKAKAFETIKLDRDGFSWGENLYKRNEFYIGVAITGKENNITSSELNLAALYIAELYRAFLKVKPTQLIKIKSITNPLISYEVESLQDHSFFAGIDQYSKVDIGSLFPTIKSLVNKHYNELASGTKGLELFG